MQQAFIHLPVSNSGKHFSFRTAEATASWSAAGLQTQKREATEIAFKQVTGHNKVIIKAIATTCIQFPKPRTHKAGCSHVPACGHAVQTCSLQYTLRPSCWGQLIGQRWQ